MVSLDSPVAVKDFVLFIKEHAPNFYEYTYDNDWTFYQVVCALHKESFCGAKLTVEPDSDLESKQVTHYLQMLQSAVKLHLQRIEILYGYHI